MNKLGRLEPAGTAGVNPADSGSLDFQDSDVDCSHQELADKKKSVSLYYQRQQGCSMHLETAAGFEPARRATARRRCNQLRHRAVGYSPAIVKT